MQYKEVKKSKLAFIDHSFHKKTKSANFIRELLNENFIVDNYWDDSWNGGNEFDISVCENYEYIFYFQVLSKIDNLKKIKAKIIWAPMYDGQRLDYLYWKLLSSTNILILSFSKIIENQCNKYGIKTLYIKKYINPEKFERQINFEGNHIFFWYRGGLNFNEIKNNLNPQEIDSFFYLSNPDPNNEREVIDETDIEKYKITIIESKFMEQREYLNYLYQTNIFIAPRKQEGIGMSFLEALAIGHSVIANNDATMNEYVIDGYNGYLFDDNLKKINLKDNRMILENNKKNKKINYEKWESNKKEIIKFILHNKKKNTNFMKFYFYKFINILSLKIKYLK